MLILSDSDYICIQIPEDGPLHEDSWTRPEKGNNPAAGPVSTHYYTWLWSQKYVQLIHLFKLADSPSQF